MQLCAGILCAGADRRQTGGQRLYQSAGIRHGSVLQGGVQCVDALLELCQTGGQLLHLLEALCGETAAQTVRQGLQAGSHLCAALLELCRTAGQACCAVFQLAAAAVQGLCAAVGCRNAVGIAADTVGKCTGTVRQCHCAVCQRACAARQLIHAVRQCLRTAVDRCHAVGIGFQTAFQGLCTVYESKGAVRQKLQIIGDLGVAVLQIGHAVLDLERTVSRIAHAAADRTQLVEDGLGILLGHALRNFFLDLCQRRFAHLACDVVRAGIGDILEFHLLRLVIHQRGGVFREVFRNGDDHIICAVLNSLFCLVCADKVEIQLVIFPQFVYQFVSDSQFLALIVHRLVIVDHCHRQLIHIPVRIPHGTQEQGGIDGRDQNNCRHCDAIEVPPEEILFLSGTA